MRYETDMYNKLFTKILDSSIWLEDDSTRLIWLTFLAVMDEDGFAQFASVANLAHRARVPLVDAQKAVEKLEDPDDCSSDPDNHGRRVERIPGGWLVLNSGKYREIVTREIAREKTRDRVAKFRARNAPVTVGNAPVTVGNVSVTPSETETETLSETETKNDHHDRFAQWWALYPKKLGKGEARKCFDRLKPSASLFEKMRLALTWQRTQPQWTREHGKFVPNPATYLNRESWDDEPFFAASDVLAPSRHDQTLKDIEEGKYDR